MPPSNRAVWLTAGDGSPFVIKEAAYPQPTADEIVVKVHAIGINPLDWKSRDFGLLVESFPAIIGNDIAGEVVEVGSRVTALKPGQRVMSFIISLEGYNPTNGAFQQYVPAPAIFTAPISADMSFADAVVLPTGISTASAALFQPDYLGLPLPTLGAGSGGKGTVLIWGGSSCVGSASIQLAKAAGMEVFTTASNHNHDYVKHLGADQVFDHTSSTVVEDIISAFEGRNSVGAYDCISSPDTFGKCKRVMDQVKGNRFIATVLPVPEDMAEGTTTKMVSCPPIARNHVGPGVWRDYVPKALASGVLKIAPPPLVAGHGLEAIETGVNRNKAGISAKKVVVTP